jgi:hypothetical protein
MRRAIALILLSLPLLLLAATCGGDGVPLDSGVEGVVTIGPMCPVVQEASPCPNEQYQADIVVLDADGDEALSFQSGEDGAFVVSLAPGSYTLVPLAPNDGAPPSAPEQQVDVRPGEYTLVVIQYDSGIR